MLTATAIPVPVVAEVALQVGGGLIVSDAVAVVEEPLALVAV
jgi:hypothetical protein